MASLDQNVLRILVVEDEPDLIDFFMTVLEPMGARIDWATTAEEAEAAVTEKDYGLVIADHRLAGERTGLDLYACCQRERPELPFLLMSGFSDQVFQALLKAQGLSCPTYLEKPFSVATCQRTVGQVLGVPESAE